MGSFNMMKVNIEQRTVYVPARCLPAGTFFQYKDETREASHGILLKVDGMEKAVNLYSGMLVSILDLPYTVINDVEFKGWV